MQLADRHAAALRLLDAMIWRDVAAVHAFYDLSFEQIREHFDQCHRESDDSMRVFCARAMLGPSNYSLVDGFVDPGGMPSEPGTISPESTDAR
jgi:hypothetical protein